MHRWCDSCDVGWVGDDTDCWCCGAEGRVKFGYTRAEDPMGAVYAAWADWVRAGGVDPPPIS